MGRLIEPERNDSLYCRFVCVLLAPPTLLYLKNKRGLISPAPETLVSSPSPQFHRRHWHSFSSTASLPTATSLSSACHDRHHQSGSSFRLDLSIISSLFSLFFLFWKTQKILRTAPVLISIFLILSQRGAWLLIIQDRRWN